jgi:hypothetical protein
MYQLTVVSMPIVLTNYIYTHVVECQLIFY